jgi:hypothetical protein
MGDVNVGIGVVKADICDKKGFTGDVKAEI